MLEIREGFRVPRDSTVCHLLSNLKVIRLTLTSNTAIQDLHSICEVDYWVRLCSKMFVATRYGLHS